MCSLLYRFCSLYRAIQGEPSSGPQAQHLVAERREEIGPAPGPR